MQAQISSYKRARNQKNVWLNEEEAHLGGRLPQKRLHGYSWKPCWGHSPQRRPQKPLLRRAACRRCTHHPCLFYLDTGRSSKPECKTKEEEEEKQETAAKTKRREGGSTAETAFRIYLPADCVLCAHLYPACALTYRWHVTSTWQAFNINVDRTALIFPIDFPAKYMITLTYTLVAHF